MAGKYQFNLTALKDRLRSRSFSGVKKQREDLTAKHVYQIAKKNRFPTWHQWRQLPSLLSKRESLTFKLALGVGAASFLLGVFGFYFTHQTVIPAVGGEYTEGLVGEPQFLNPILSPGSTVDTDLTRLVFRGLFLFDPTSGTVQPDLAETVETSEDGKSYTIHLRRNATWHDGKPVTSNDVVFTFGAIANPEYKSPLSLSFRGITIESIDEFTLRFTLPEPFNGFLSLLDVGILPAHVWESVAPKRANLTSLNLSPIGNGPYQFEKFSKDQNGVIRSYTLKRYQDFYGNRPHIETLTFKFYPDTDSAREALLNRNVEGLAYLSQEEARLFVSNRFTKILRPSLPQETILFFNDSRQEQLKNAKLREALGLVIDREHLIQEIFDGHATPLTGPLLPGSLAPLPEPTIKNIERAEALLDETDWQRDPISRQRVKKATGAETEPERLQLELVTTEASDMLALAEYLKKAWTDLGVSITITSVPQTRFHADVIKNRSFDILLTGILFGEDRDAFPFWHSSQVNDPGVNLAQYSNRNVDEALETIRTTTEEEKRIAALTTFQDLILKDHPAIFLIQPTYAYLVASKIEGITLDHIISPSDRFNRIEDWYIKTKNVFRLSSD